jgi:hypothetical protein
MLLVNFYKPGIAPLVSSFPPPGGKELTEKEKRISTDIDNRARTVDCKGLIVRWIALFHP